MDDNETYSSSFSKKTKFSGDWLKFERISNLWTSCHEYACSGRLMEWNFKLDRVWQELVAHAKEASDKTFNFETEFFRISKEIQENKKNPERLYILLMEKETLLRKLEDKSGLASKYMEEDEDEF